MYNVHVEKHAGYCAAIRFREFCGTHLAHDRGLLGAWANDQRAATP